MKLSVVTSLYESGRHVEEFYRRSCAAAAQITDDFEVVFVNDGSEDDSLSLAVRLCEQDRRVRVVDLSRNFGHQAALFAGLATAAGEFVFLIDSDLEEQPELLATLWEAMQRDGSVDVAYGVQTARKGGWFERFSGKLFYFVLRRLLGVNYPQDTLTARLMKRRYVDSILAYPEREMDLWYLFMLAGFRQQPVPAVKLSKTSSAYTLRRKLRLAVQTITAASSRPLVWVSVAGLAITFASLAAILYLVAGWLAYDAVVEGWTSILVSVWFLGGVILLSLGVSGIYMHKVFLEVKGRPRYVIRHLYEQEGGDE